MTISKMKIEDYSSSIDLEKSKKPLFKESDAGDGTTRKDQLLHGTKLYACSIALLLCLFLVALDQMIVLAVLTDISSHFNEFTKFTWITAAFMTPLGCLAQFWGRISISFGRKWVMLTGIALFEVGSLIAGVSTSMDMLIGGRAIQGAGGSCIQTLVMIIITEITSIDNRAPLLGCVSIVYVVASVLGPILGGVFGTNVSWRWCFYINLCFGGIIIPFFMYSYRPKSPVGNIRERMQSIDITGNFLLVASFVLILLGISFGQDNSNWKNANDICCFVLGGILLIAFCIYNFKYSTYQVIPTKIALNWPIFAAFITYSLSFAVLMVTAQFICIYAENVLGHNALHTGFFIIPCAVATCITSACCAIMIKFTRYLKPFCIIGGLCLPVAAGLGQLIKSREQLGIIIAIEIFLGIGPGFNFQGPLMSSLLHAPKEPSSSILTNAFLNFGRSVGTALFSEIASAIYVARLKRNIKHVIPLLQKVTVSLEQVSVRPELLKQFNSHDKSLILDQMVDALKMVFWLVFAMGIVCLLGALFMSSKRVPKSKNVEK